MSSKKCSTCGHVFEQAEVQCPECGLSGGITLTPDPARVRLEAHPASVILSGSDPETGDISIDVRDPLGMRSEARLTTGGRITLVVTGAEGVGRSGERRAVHTLREHLQGQGRGVGVVLREGIDARGEDRILEAEGDDFVVQVTTVPQARDFWRDADTSSARTDVSVPHGGSWLRDAIEAKASRIPPGQRASILLLIDARHAGILTAEQVTTEYLVQHPDPVKEFGFASVWVVGPTAGHCTKLGTGRP